MRLIGVVGQARCCGPALAHSPVGLGRFYSMRAPGRPSCGPHKQQAPNLFPTPNAVLGGMSCSWLRLRRVREGQQVRLGGVANPRLTPSPVRWGAPASHTCARAELGECRIG